MTFKVVLLLPAVLNGCHEMCSHPWWFVLAHTHARTHTRTQREHTGNCGIPERLVFVFAAP